MLISEALSPAGGSSLVCVMLGSVFYSELFILTRCFCSTEYPVSHWVPQTWPASRCPEPFEIIFIISSAREECPLETVLTVLHISALFSSPVLLPPHCDLTPDKLHCSLTIQDGPCTSSCCPHSRDVSAFLMKTPSVWTDSFLSWRDVEFF